MNEHICPLCNSKLIRDTINGFHYYCPNKEKIIFDEFSSSSYIHYNLHIYIAAELKEAMFARKQELFKLVTFGYESFLEIRAEDGGWDTIYTFDYNMPLSIKSINNVNRMLNLKAFL